MTGVQTCALPISKGLIRVSNQFETNVPGVYAAGDAVNGGTTAVQGIAEAMQAAAAMAAAMPADKRHEAAGA